MLSLNRSSKCPNCGSHQYYKSRRRGLWEHILHSIFSLSPLRCTNCDERYFRFRRARAPIENRRQHPA